MDALTVRQRLIAELAALGFSNCEIAIELSVTAAVVQAELEALYRALGDGGTGTTTNDIRGVPTGGDR